MKVHVNDGFAQVAVDKILLNGIEEGCCTMADTELGAIECFKRDKNGRFLRIDGELCKEERNGKVEIIFKDGWGMDDDGCYTFKTPNNLETYVPFPGTIHET